MTTFKNLFESVYNEKMDNLKRGYEWELSKINNNDFDCYYHSRCDARLRAYKRGKITIEQFKKSIINCYEIDLLKSYKEMNLKPVFIRASVFNQVRKLLKDLM